MSSAPRRTRRLARSEALALLGSVRMGRVVFTHHALPAIRPVDHVLDDDAIIIRSGFGAEIVGVAGRTRGTVVAYEADDIDPDLLVGWSVIVTGTARLVRDPAAVERYQGMLRAWVDAGTDELISISPDLVTGVRLVGKECPS